MTPAEAIARLRPLERALWYSEECAIVKSALPVLLDIAKAADRISKWEEHHVDLILLREALDRLADIGKEQA